MKEVEQHLRKDPGLNLVLETVPLRAPRRESDMYFVLLRAIVGQQLSVKAAATIWERFRNLFADRYPKAEELLSFSDEALRGCGLSFQKIGYLRNIARFSLEEDMSDQYLDGLSDAEVIAYLSTIKGVGKWTVEMLLIFALARPDVFPVDDLGVRNAMLKLYAVKTTGKSAYGELEQIASHWAPYRSYGCLLMWDWKDGKGLPG